MNNKDQKRSSHTSSDKDVEKQLPPAVDAEKEVPETSNVKPGTGAKAARKPKTIAAPKSAVPGQPKNLIEAPQTETSPMEVHHHPQLEHKPKPFKEYLLEGFMIFVAVMMGFIAENIREGIDNNEQVKHLTTQLVQDLKADSLQLDSVYIAEGKILQANDSLLTLLKEPLDKIDTRKLQKLVYMSHSLWPFHPAGGAIGAIKNQLNLKQFSSSKIISYTARYEQHTELIHTVQDITLLYQRTYLDPFLLQHFTAVNIASTFDGKDPVDGQMRNLTQSDLTQLAANMVLIRINTQELLRDQAKLKTDAADLLRYIKQQFGNED